MNRLGTVLAALGVVAIAAALAWYFAAAPAPEETAGADTPGAAVSTAVPENGAVSATEDVDTGAVGDDASGPVSRQAEDPGPGASETDGPAEPAGAAEPVRESASQRSVGPPDGGPAEDLSEASGAAVDDSDGQRTDAGNAARTAQPERRDPDLAGVSEEPAQDETADAGNASERTASEESAPDRTARATEERQPSADARTAEGDPSGAGTASDGRPGPSFDIVRVERDGSSVMAGRATPGSEVVVRREGEEVARGRADGRGDFVLLPALPLPPGDYALELEERTPAGEVRESPDLVVISVPERAPRAAAGVAEGQPAADADTDRPGTGSVTPSGTGTRDAPLVVRVPRAETGQARVLQMPEPQPDDTVGGLWLEAVDYDPSGALVISGRGLPERRVVAYLDNALLSEARVDTEGRWRIAPEGAVAPGLYSLRIDQLNADGEVVARVESPFARAAFDTEDLPADERFVVIQPGNNLWTIARGTYGAGPRYTVIFEANRDQIRDPDLIYPGQIFVLPNGRAG